MRRLFQNRSTKSQLRALRIASDLKGSRFDFARNALFFWAFFSSFPGIWGFGGNKKSLFFWWFSLPFPKSKERKDRECTEPCPSFPCCLWNSLFFRGKKQGFFFCNPAVGMCFPLKNRENPCKLQEFSRNPCFLPFFLVFWTSKKQGKIWKMTKTQGFLARKFLVFLGFEVSCIEVCMHVMAMVAQAQLVLTCQVLPTTL